MEQEQIAKKHGIRGARPEVSGEAREGAVESKGKIHTNSGVDI